MVTRMKSLAIAVELKKAEKIRRALVRNNSVIQNLRFKRDNEFIYIPIREGITGINNYRKLELDFKEKKKEPKLYKDILSIPENLKQNLPHSFDIIGDIIFIKLQDELLSFKKEIGGSLLKTNKNIKSVCLIKPVKGELRIRDLEIIAGEYRTKTLHKEYGLNFHIDVSKAYFSPRLATERKRIADLVKKDEVIVDMFAGVAPFSIMIAKYAQPKIIYALDKNIEAIRYAQKNVKENKFLDKIEVIYSDAKNIKNILNNKGCKADRIIMNLPFSSYSFFKNAIKVIGNKCIIHYYEILKENDIKEKKIKLENIAYKQNVILKTLNVRKIKTYAPREFYIGIDITATRNMPM